MSESVGVSSGGLLFPILLVLKLTEVIDWSWWWIAAPLWFPFALLLPLTLFAAAKSK